jgi:flagellar hook-basal body complex protein FliE
MSDPLGLIRNSTQTGQVWSQRNGAGSGVGAGATGSAGGPTFKDVLLSNLNDANKAQQEATAAVEDLTSGRRDDVENVILAANKADTAFRMLQSLRNRMVEAYDEIKQVRI